VCSWGGSGDRDGLRHPRHWASDLPAIQQLDFPVVQAGVMMLSLIIVAVNFIVDLLYLYLNPQVRIS